MIKSLEILAKNRDALLLAETAAWLHMLGKYSPLFVSQKNGYNYKNYKNFFEDANHPLNSILSDTWVNGVFQQLNTALSPHPNSLGEFLEKHTDQNAQEKLLRVLIDAHGRGSGSEKGVRKKESYVQGQSDTYLSNAFGYEPRFIDLEQLKIKKAQLFEFLTQKLGELRKGLDGNAWPEEQRSQFWKEWRAPFIQRLFEDFSKTVGDTRRPINDISLWDQTSAAVAFFKVELAHVLLIGWQDPLDKTTEKYKYRTLRVSLDGAAFMSRSQRVGDILARRELLDQTWARVKNAIEIKYPLGLEIYRDNNGIVFLVPDIEALLSFATNSRIFLKSLREVTESVFDGEARIAIKLSDNGSRNVFYIGNQLRIAEKPLSPTRQLLENAWLEAEDKCRVCQVRPQGFGADQIDDYRDEAKYYREKARNRKICCICMARMQGRSEDWATENLDKTIWIDEVADTNGRVALLAASFNFSSWLNGQLVSSLAEAEGNKKGVTFSQLVADFNQDESTELKNLNNYSKLGTTYAKTIQGLFDLLITDEDLDEAIFKSIPKSQRLALAVWRKTPSFARLRRIWETCERFWKESVEKQLTSSSLVGTVDNRLIIKGDLFDSESQDAKELDGLGHYHAYEIPFNGINMEVVWDEGKKRLIVATNLQYLAKRLGAKPEECDTLENAVQWLQRNHLKDGNDLNILEPRTSATGKPVPAGHIRDITVKTEPHNYTPAISILTEPKQFMVLVPANKALEVVQHIKAEYEVQFSHVKNRLPLHLNVVFFNRKQPLYAAIDAARRMLVRESSINTDWIVGEVSEADGQGICNHSDGRLGNRVRKLRLSRKEGKENLVSTEILQMNNKLKTLVSYSTGDPNTEDIWYPYFFIKKAGKNAKPIDERNLYFQAPLPGSGGNNEFNLVHVKEIEVGDEVCYAPSTLDFEFLDVTARRFELSYDEASGMRLPKADELYSTRPFLLEDLDIIQQLWKLVAEDESTAITTTQLRQITEAIETKRQDWQITEPDNDTLRRFVEQTFQRAFGKRWNKIPGDQREHLILWATSGRWRDIIELEMQILKKQSLAAKASQVK